MVQFKSNFSYLFLVLGCIFASSACNSNAQQKAIDITKPLARGNPVDLAQLNFQTANLDQLFANLAYVKNFKLGQPKFKYNKTQPLLIKPYILYNITEPRIIERYTKREVYSINKGEMYGDTLSIERSVPIIGLKDADLRPLGYWSQKEILFNRLYTSSTTSNKLIRIRLESEEIKGITEQTYQKLVEQLKIRYKTIAVKIEPQDNRPNSYQWKTKEQVVYLMFNKDAELSYITLIIAFINPDTKGYLPEFGH